MNLTYHPLIGSESTSRYGAFGIRIEVAHKVIEPLLTTRRDLENETELERAIHHAAYDAEKLIKDAVMSYVVSKDSAAQERRAAERAQLIGLFPTGCFVEEIPNGYCSDWCCKHLPWFVVTTSVGRITIGWRKRVIEIDWESIKAAKTAEELFPKDDVTKTSRLIHAWSVEDAKRYIDTVIASATAP